MIFQSVKQKSTLSFFIGMLIFLCSGCHSYHLAENGYLVNGDDRFISIEQTLDITLGDDFKVWQDSITPHNTSQLSGKFNRVLKKLGYSSAAYSLLFHGKVVREMRGYDLIILVNHVHQEKYRRKKQEMISRLESKRLGKSSWFYEITSLKDQKIYHAVFPEDGKLWSEKYISMVYIPVQNSGLDTAYIERVTSENAISHSYFPGKIASPCLSDADEVNYEYRIPEEVLVPERYMILKLLKNDLQTENNLVFYSLLQPGVSLGAFQICRGKYRMEYTTLEGRVIWATNLILENQSSPAK